jgi:hypothetical protein
MANLRKIVLFISTLAMLLYIAIEIGIITMLIAVIIFNTVAFAVFVYWALRPAPTHRNKLQSFNLTFESKRIEFELTENGLYRINLCTKHFSEIKARKEQLEVLQNKDGSNTYHWPKMPMTLKREYFTKDIVVELTEELLTEKQAIKTYLFLLEESKTQSICNATYISEIIKTKCRPLFFTVERLQKIEKYKTFVKKKISLFYSSPPTFDFETKDNRLMVLVFFLMSNMDIQAYNLLESESPETILKLAAIAFIILKYITKYNDYIKNDCVG